MERLVINLKIHAKWFGIVQLQEKQVLTYRNIQPGIASLQPLSQAWREWSTRYDPQSSVGSTIAKLLLLHWAILRRRSAHSLQNKLKPDIRWYHKVRQSCSLESSQKLCHVDHSHHQCSPVHQGFHHIDRNHRRLYLRMITTKLVWLLLEKSFE